MSDVDERFFGLRLRPDLYRRLRLIAAEADSYIRDAVEACVRLALERHDDREIVRVANEIRRERRMAETAKRRGVAGVGG